MDINDSVAVVVKNLKLLYLLLLLFWYQSPLVVKKQS